ncbi:MAG: hypothetical protein IIW48_07150 [Clostridia bacterium]|nr:hypothetical protein [Clostridia bacterium]
MKYLFVGGDKRQAYAAEYIRKSGECAQLALDSAQLHSMFSDADCVVLPLPVSRDGIHINSLSDKCVITLDELFSELKSGVIVLGGMPDKDLIDRLECKGIKLYDYYENEVLLMLNSIPTAEGVIYELIGGSDINLHGAKTLVTGYGKAASAIAARLVALGSQVTVAARSERDRTAALCDGCKAISLYNISGVIGEMDFVANTVPATVIDKSCIAVLKKSCVMVEVASAPYGIDFDAADEYGIKVIKVPSLPGRISPASAGEAIAKAVLSIVKGMVGENG